MPVSKKGYLEAAHRMAYALVRTGMQAWTGTQGSVSDTPNVSVGQRLQASQGSEVIITMTSHVSQKHTSHIRHTYNFTAHHFSKSYTLSTSMADHTFEYVVDEQGNLPSTGELYSTDVGSMFMYYTDEDDYNSQVEFSITIVDS